MSSDPRPPKRPLRSSLECVICFEEYDLDARVPIIGTCGHTMCSTCRNQDGMLLKCPICQKENSFENEVKNFLVVELIEEKLSETKRPKTDPGCFLCQTSTDGEDSHVCLECVQKKGYSDFEDLKKKVDSFKMCSRCVEAMQNHGGHDTQKLCETKSGLQSMYVQLKMEKFCKFSLPRLDKYQKSCEIFNDTFKRLQKACMMNGRMFGSDDQFKALNNTFAHELNRFEEAVGANISNLWKLTKEVLEATQAVTAEKEKLQGREFTTAEESTFRAIVAPTRPLLDDDYYDPNVTMEDWEKMTIEEKKASALEMSYLSDDEEAPENEGEAK